MSAQPKYPQRGHDDYEVFDWLAWRPVRIGRGWVWLRMVTRYRAKPGHMFGPHSLYFELRGR